MNVPDANRDSRIEKWVRWLEQPIKPEILGMHDHRDVYRTVAEITQKHGALPPSHFFDYLSDTYATTQAVAVRRQAEVSPRVISLGSLLKEVAQDSERLTRDWFVGQYDDLDRAHGERVFVRDFGGDVGNHLDPKVVTADLDALAAAANGIKDY